MIKATAEEGVVLTRLDSGKLKILLPEVDVEIEVFEDEIRPIILSPQQTTEGVPVPGKPLGIQVAFEPVFKGDDIPEKYLIHLINPSDASVIFEIKFNVSGEEAFKEHGKLAPKAILQLGDLYYDELNDNPGFELDCCRITTDGTGARQQRTIKIKAKQFFKNIQQHPLLMRTAHVYQVFDQLKTARKAPQEDLKSYTKQHITEKPKFSASAVDLKSNELKSRAEFSGELDLHIDKLVDDPGTLRKSEILQLQLRRFDEYIDRALRLGVDRVFIIHGVGEGKLRNAIATRLLQLTFIKTFKNEFHPKYGFGATEVIFD